MEVECLSLSLTSSCEFGVSISSIKPNKLSTSNGKELGYQDRTAIGLVILSMYNPPFYNSSYNWMHQSYVKTLTQEIKKTQYTEDARGLCLFPAQHVGKPGLHFGLHHCGWRAHKLNNPSCEMSPIQSMGQTSGLLLKGCRLELMRHQVTVTVLNMYYLNTTPCYKCTNNTGVMEMFWPVHTVEQYVLICL